MVKVCVCKKCGLWLEVDNSGYCELCANSFTFKK
jgi:hypothetical protein